MTAVRIVCTHDAKKLAETLARLLGAEGDDVRISYGRQSLEALPAAREAKEAVLLIWSYDAPSAHYMLEWADAIAPERVAEIARAAGWPRTKRCAPVIDFASWRGERGGRAWNALAERLRVISKIVDPRPEPLRGPAIGVGLAGAMAAGVALMVSANPTADVKEVALEPDKISLALIDGDGVGGAVDAIEPASMDDGMHLSVRGLGPGAALLPGAPGTLAPLPHHEPILLDARERSLLQRLSALNPLRDGEEN